MLSETDYLLKKNRILSRSLIASGAINILVLALFSFWIIRERPPTPYCELKPKKQPSVVQLVNPPGIMEYVAKLSKLSFHQLIDLLRSQHPVHGIYTERDLALACLTTFHHFDLSRALKPQELPQQKHVIKLTAENGKAIYFTVYPDLSSKDMLAIVKFARLERWPMTTQGLFLILKKQMKVNRMDPSLLETLGFTPEFWSMELLLSRAEQSITKAAIAEMLVEGTWEMLKQFTDEQSKLNDLSESRRHYVLLEYLRKHSKKSAELLLKLDWDFALKKTNESDLLQILGLLTDCTAENERFAKEVLASPHSQKVWKSAAKNLYAYAGEEMPEIWEYQKIITRFIDTHPQKVPVFPPTALLSAPIKKTHVPLSVPIARDSTCGAFYTVQSGDSLWKISRKFNVSIEKIRKTNRLTSDTLKPGTVLKIP